MDKMSLLILKNNQKNSTFEIHNDDVEYLVIDVKIAINEGYEYKRIIMNDNGWELTDTK